MSHLYLLDTNICIYIINQRPLEVIEKMIQIGANCCALSSIVVSELAFGVEKSSSLNNKKKLESFLSIFSILPYDEKCVWHYAQLRNHLQQSGTPIGSLDMLIAAHALATNSILVSNNLKEFSRIPHLKYENWLNSINKGTP